MNKGKNISLSGLAMVGMIFITGSVWASDTNQKMIERGRYLITITGCNDCHTPGYAPSGGKTPESQWLVGDGLGWQGPWGTTYASNLRLYIKSMTEDQWVADAKILVRRPPMPWFALNKMAENDLRAIYQYIRSLGNPGSPAPAFVPPGVEAHPPYVSFPAPPPE